MHSSAETSELIQIFKDLDSLKVGYLTLEQFGAYIGKQPRKIQQYLINEVLISPPSSSTSCPTPE